MARRAVIEATRAVVEAAAALPAERYDRLALSPELRNEINIVRNLKASGARNRQVAHIAKGLSDARQVELQSALESFAADDAALLAHEVKLNDWRDRLIADGDPAIEALVKICPRADRQRLRQLTRQARDGDGAAKARRTLFKVVRAAFESKG